LLLILEGHQDGTIARGIEGLEIPLVYAARQIKANW